jgi:hypothetical protein
MIYKIIFLGCLFISNSTVAQNLGTLTHYYRVLPIDVNDIPSLCDSFDSQLFKVQIDRNLYDQGKVEIKKLVISDLFRVGFSAQFENNRFTQIHYRAKGKKNIRNLKQILQDDLGKGFVFIDNKRRFEVKFHSKCSI